MSKSLALFDFDGTLTRRDTLPDFIGYAVGLPKAITGCLLLSPVLICYIVDLYDNSKAKERVLSYFFKGWTKEKFFEIGSKYAQDRIPAILNTQAINKLNVHLTEGHEVAIVTASVEDWIKAWTDKLGIRLIATQMEVREGNITGKFATRNCYGEEKVRRVMQSYNLDDFDTVYAYGDTPGDKPMLGLADRAFYKRF